MYICKRESNNSPTRAHSLFLILLFVLLNFTTLALHDSLAQDISWLRQFGSTGQGEANRIAIDQSGNIYIGGSVEGALPSQSAVGNADAWLRKYTNNGIEIWTRQFGTTLGDDLTGLAVDNTGSVVVAGHVRGALPGLTSVGSSDAFVRKYDSDGNEIWTRQFGTIVGDTVADLAVDVFGNIYVAGSVGNALPGQIHFGLSDVYLRKYDTYGNEIWTRQFGTPMVEGSIGMEIDKIGNIYVGGNTEGTFPGQGRLGAADIFLSKYDPNGNEIWTRQFGSWGYDGTPRVELVADHMGSVYLLSNTEGILPGQLSVGERDMFLRKYDNNGNEVWTRQFGTQFNDTAWSLVIGSGGGVFIGGSVEGTLPFQISQTSPGLHDAFIREYDGNGNEVWTYQFGTAEHDYIKSVAVDSSGDIYAAGATHGILPLQSKFGTRDPFVINLMRPASNHSPIAANTTVEINEDIPFLIALIASDVDGDILSYMIVDVPGNGTLTGTAPNLMYTPNENYYGTDGFRFFVSDGILESNIAIVNIIVNSVNDSPTITVINPMVEIDEGQLAGNGGTVADIDDDPVTITAPVGEISGAWWWNMHAGDGPTDTQTVFITVDDGNGGIATTTFDLIVNNVAPTVSAGVNQTVNRNTPVTLTGTWTDPAGGSDNPYTWSWDVNGDGVSDASGAASYGESIPITTSFAIEGSYVATFSVTDKDGATGSDSTVITVLNQPPVCTNALPSIDFLWPPQHQMVPVTIQNATDPDGDTVWVTITSIFQDEPTNGTGDGDTAPDGEGVGTAVAILRAERAGDANGRVYQLAFTASDGHGGACSGVLTVGVRHDQGKKGEAIDDGPLYDSTQP